MKTPHLVHEMGETEKVPAAKKLANELCVLDRHDELRDFALKKMYVRMCVLPTLASPNGKLVSAGHSARAVIFRSGLGFRTPSLWRALRK